MIEKSVWIICAVAILVGILFRLDLTGQGNFIFNMDNARDMIDVREMVELRKLRLIGPTTGIDGLYTGPGWYYLLVIPYILSDGDPYASILLMILFWIIGAVFTTLTLKDKGIPANIGVFLLWIFSPYLVLVTMYALNPNPVVLLSPVLFYCLYKYLQSKQIKFVFISWAISGLFFNLEMATGICIPFVIMTIIFIKKGWKGFISKEALLGPLIMGIFLIPQILFEFRHNFFMFKSVLNNVSISQEHNLSVSRIFGVWDSAYSPVLSGTLFNNRILTFGWISLILIEFYKIYIRKSVDDLLKIILIILFVPLLLHLVVPFKVMPWHLGLWICGIIFYVGYLLMARKEDTLLSRVLKYLLLCIIFVASLSEINLPWAKQANESSADPSMFSHQIAIVDKVYTLAQGKDFKVYTYIPSVYDYQYQYIFWWWGLRKYDYLPREYSYAPNKPEYIKNKNLFSGKFFDQPSNLVFLIKEKNNPRLEDLWMNNFKDYLLVEKMMAGPLELEIRNDISKE